MPGGLLQVDTEEKRRRQAAFSDGSSAPPYGASRHEGDSSGLKIIYSRFYMRLGRRLPWHCKRMSNFAFPPARYFVEINCAIMLIQSFV
jgi:hypothetical protein